MVSYTENCFYGALYKRYLGTCGPKLLAAI